MIRIITDTSVDLTLEEANKLDVILVPMNIQFGDDSFKDRYEMEPEEFYKLLVRYDHLPVTSQVNPYSFEEEFEKAKEAGDDVIIITLSSALSGTYQSANIATDDYEDMNIHIIDSKTVTVSQQCLVRYACKLRSEGYSADDIARMVSERVDDVKVLGLLDTLEYLKKGGRISPATAWAGGMLSIKPAVTTENGEVAVIGKARGSKNGNNLLKKMIYECGGIDYNMPIVLGYAGNSRDLLDVYIEDSKELYEGKVDELIIERIGSTIGTHVGPGSIAIGFFPNKNN